MAAVMSVEPTPARWREGWTAMGARERIRPAVPVSTRSTWLSSRCPTIVPSASSATSDIPSTQSGDRRRQSMQIRLLGPPERGRVDRAIAA